MSMMHTKARRGHRRAAAGQGNPWLKPGSIIAIVILAVAFLAALFPVLFTSSDPYAGTDVALLPPGENGHLMGTDAVGRDLYALSLIHI